MSSQTLHPVTMTPPRVKSRKGGDPLVCLTAYDAPTASILDPHCDILLVGDSVGMVVHGLPNTIAVTLEMMILHGRAVVRGASRSLVVVDMPFSSYEKSPEQAYENAARILKETGAQAVKLESGPYVAETIRFLSERGIPVMGHVGLRPQAALSDGGFKTKGRDEASRMKVIEEARATADAGAFCMVIEGVAEDLARDITAEVDIPTIGIGASSVCDGQILVTNDMLGQSDWVPKFVRKFADIRSVTDEAVKAYAEAVRARTFPGDEHVYGQKQDKQ